MVGAAFARHRRSVRLWRGEQLAGMRVACAIDAPFARIAAMHWGMGHIHGIKGLNQPYHQLRIPLRWRWDALQSEYTLDGVFCGLIVDRRGACRTARGDLDTRRA